ncbi:MAG: SGNH/GDSL hydrolase family protein [Clostridia bacterium]|nr:SGNH/GDSL hydrolase family protein [Clostridia bacterium]
MDNLNNEKGNLYIAFLGGSITQGAGASGTITYKDDAGTGSGRWSSQITKRYFQKQYPNKNVIEVNAGIGGTSSDLGLFRMKEQLIDACGEEGPDVVFVEFAVNDMYYSNFLPQKVHQRMEGIVRQLAALPKQPVIIFVYTAAYRPAESPINNTIGFDPYLKSAQVQQEVADYYQIGSVNLCEFVAGGVDLEGNPIVWDSSDTENTWTMDGTHPNNKGYTGYTDVIKKEFEEHPEQYFKKLTWQEIPMSDYEFGSPQMVSPVNHPDVTTTGTWNTDMGFSGRFRGGALKSVLGGSTITYRFTGRSIGVFSSFSDKGGGASYVIDMGSANPIYGTMSTEASYSYWMDNAPLLNFDLPPGDHTIKITVKSPTNTSSKDGFVIGYFLVDPQQPDPIVSNVTIDSKEKALFDTALKGSYSYVNAVTEEGDTLCEWLAGNSKNGSYTPIEGANKASYTPGFDMVGKYIKFRVTPKDSLGNVGKTVTSEPVLVTLPSVKDCFTANEIVYSLAGENTVAKTKVTNKLEGHSLKVVMLMAEYQVSENGTKTLLQSKKIIREIEGGATQELSGAMKSSGRSDSLIKTMVWSELGLEPILPAGELKGGRVEKAFLIRTERDEDEAPVFVYEINWMD